MPNQPATREQVLALLADNPRRLMEITVRLTPAQAQASPGPGEWSANEVLAHLRCCADVWGKGLAIILEKENPMIRAVSPRGWIKRTNYLELPFASSMGAFTEQRASLLARLNALAPTEWSRTATVQAAGKRTTWTLLAYAERLATHEHHHLAQFRKIATAVSDVQGRTVSESTDLGPTSRLGTQ